MFDKQFDPYEILEKLAQQSALQAQQIEVIVKTMEQHKTTIEQLIEAHNKNVDLIKNLVVDTKELQDRQLLLEVARQYENTKNT